VTKSEYLDEVRYNLSVLPKDEVDMAIRFYDEYLTDAENEAEAMEELGKPYHLAKSVISEQSAFTRSAMYIEHKQTRNVAKPESVFAYAETPKVNLPNIKRADEVQSNNIDLSINKDNKKDRNEPFERISRRAFILAMTAIICGTFIVGGVMLMLLAYFVF
jgi:uncharacterized membrane protein